MIKLFNNVFYIQFLKFVIIGSLSTLVNYSVFFILYKYVLINYLYSAAIGFLLGVFVGYFFNKYWTFQYLKKKIATPIFYLIVYCFSLVFNLFVLYLLVDFVGLDPLLGNLIAIACSTITNFLGVKFIVFRKG